MGIEGWGCLGCFGNRKLVIGGGGLRVVFLWLYSSRYWLLCPLSINP